MPFLRQKSEIVHFTLSHKKWVNKYTNSHFLNYNQSSLIFNKILFIKLKSTKGHVNYSKHKFANSDTVFSFSYCIRNCLYQLWSKFQSLNKQIGFITRKHSLNFYLLKSPSKFIAHFLSHSKMSGSAFTASNNLHSPLLLNNCTVNASVWTL